MKERTHKRQLIHVLGRHSNWQEDGIGKALRSENVYAGSKDWTQFLNYLLIGLGASFLIAGVVFFFAFNWDSLHKFVKLGIIQGLIVLCGVWVLFGKSNELLKKIMLTVMSCLTGVLFAVFGQIYQTGANACDFFLGWTIFIAFWALVSGFPPLWLVLLVLIQTTISLYAVQVSERLTHDVVFVILAAINILVVVKTESLYRLGWLKSRPSWFIYTVALAAIAILTFAIVLGMNEKYGMNTVDKYAAGFRISIVLGAASYVAGVYYGIVTRNIFYLSSTGFSVIIILTALLIRSFDDPISIFFLAGLFIVLTTTFLIRELIRLNKKWHAE